MDKLNEVIVKFTYETVTDWTALQPDDLYIRFGFTDEIISGDPERFELALMYETRRGLQDVGIYMLGKIPPEQCLPETAEASARWHENFVNTVKNALP